MQQKPDEKMDPLTRIQEEIKEVVRREEEHRQLASATVVTVTNGNAGELESEQQLEPDLELEQEQEQLQQDQGVVVTAQPAAVTALLAPIEEQSPSNTPSLASSVNSSSHKEESLDEQHSDDSGISASSQKINSNSNGNNNNNNNSGKGGLKLSLGGRQEQRYIGPNCYSMTPEPPQQKLMTRTPSTPSMLQQQQQRQFAFGGATKGVMQRFIASHGKLQLGGVSPGINSPATPLLLSTPNAGSPTLKLNARNALAFLESGSSSPLGLAPTVVGVNGDGTANGNATSALSQGAIERDSEGRPLRRGYVPVEQKIQRELQDLKSRESELKRLRKLNRQHMLEKLQLSTDDEADAEADVDDDDEDSEVEHCYGPGKLRNAQSTLELERDSNDQELMGHKSSGNRSLNVSAVLSNGGHALATNGSNSGMRPAMSLAELCDLTPEEAPSSHRLIAQWESLIKKNAEGIEAAI